MEDLDRLLSGRVKARFSREALHRARKALAAATRDVLQGVPDEELDDAVDAFRLLRALQAELAALVDGVDLI